ncbi:unnamed protein product [Amoebophrya sp. A25]|nr:unnamed protein product [Amoebophrya sp. A25]|eukprot:GSA25T00020588001.1
MPAAAGAAAANAAHAANAMGAARDSYAAWLHNLPPAEIKCKKIAEEAATPATAANLSKIAQLCKETKTQMPSANVQALLLAKDADCPYPTALDLCMTMATGEGLWGQIDNCIETSAQRFFTCLILPLSS